jgi:hypothetical protein
MIESRLLDANRGGGDIHSVSMWGAGYVTRLALAEVYGRGSSVDHAVCGHYRGLRWHWLGLIVWGVTRG